MNTDAVVGLHVEARVLRMDQRVWSVHGLQMGDDRLNKVGHRHCLRQMWVGRAARWDKVTSLQAHHNEHVLCPGQVLIPTEDWVFKTMRFPSN